MKHQTTSPVEAVALPPSVNGWIDRVTLELLESWRRQDATTDPQQIRDAEKELAEFKSAMNESRIGAGEPVLFP